ncbi:hypothetical protein [Nocardioides dongxiaopingii]|uniref:hypothetical protein n=1 Tax=Nocardioides dongxiaopingii TaxID=2576036 RepID=UPI0010C764B9|nr:hypothetical protein [Nocardioides dongxiaopingii]
MADRPWTRSGAACAAPLLALVLALAGCSGDETPGASDTVPPAGASPSSSVPPAADGPVEAPSPGTGATVPAEGGVPAPVEVRPDGTGTVLPGVTVRLGAVTRTEGTATTPGEVSGPAVRVEVEVANTTDAEVALAPVVALSYGAEATPAPQFTRDSDPLGATLAAGASTTGVYVYALPSGSAEVSVLVSSGAARPLVFSETL